MQVGEPGGEKCGLGACVRIGRRSRISAGRRNRTQISVSVVGIGLGFSVSVRQYLSRNQGSGTVSRLLRPGQA